MTPLELDLPAVLDVCCGPRMMWFDSADRRALFIDKRRGTFARDFGTVGTRNRAPSVVAPDILASFTALPFADESFYQVVFDPPHMLRSKVGAAGRGLFPKMYGVLGKGWQSELEQGFRECFRVLKPNGTLIFKWADVSVPVSQVLLAARPDTPLFGSRRGKHTHWIVFMKAAR